MIYKIKYITHIDEYHKTQRVIKCAKLMSESEIPYIKIKRLYKYGYTLTYNRTTIIGTTIVYLFLKNSKCTKKQYTILKELLQQEFGHESQHHDEVVSENTFEPQPALTLDSIEEIPASLFQPVTHQQEAMQVAQKEKNQVKVKEERSKVIKDVFSTVKTKVLYWFENVDDEKLDN